MIGYIYIRNHLSYGLYEVCKLGKTTNIPARDTQYATGEIKRGYFEAVFEVSIEEMGVIERLLQKKFHLINVRHDAGTEFYNRKIINLIEPYLINIGIKYKKLSKQEINELSRRNRKAIADKDVKQFVECYYDLQTCKDKISEYLIMYPEIRKHWFDLSSIVIELVKVDESIPPSDIIVDYYKISDLQDIIVITNMKKRTGIS